MYVNVFTVHAHRRFPKVLCRRALCTLQYWLTNCIMIECTYLSTLQFTVIIACLHVYLYSKVQFAA